MAITLTTLRQQLFKAVDRVITTGIPLVITRKGHRLKIVLDEPKSKLSNISKHDCIVGEPEDLVALKLTEWHEVDNV